MEWIPYQRLTITTDLSKEEVLKRMRERVGPKRRENLVRVDRNIFSGDVIEDYFDLTLHTDYRNSWTPMITGVIKETNNETEIYVTLKSNWFVISFTTLFIFIGVIRLVFEIIDFKDTQDFNWTILLFILFPYGLTWFGFNLDADRSIDGLLKISKGEIK